MNLNLPKPPLAALAAEHVAHARDLTTEANGWLTQMDEQLNEPLGALGWLGVLIGSPDRYQAVDALIDEHPNAAADVILWAVDTQERNLRLANQAAYHLMQPDVPLPVEAYWKGLAAGCDPLGWIVPLPAGVTDSEDPFAA